MSNLAKASPSNLAKVWQAIQKMAKSAPEAEQAVERSRQLPDVIDTTRYAPSALARASLMRPAAQRGFSESIVSTKPPIASFLMKPSEFLERTPPLSETRDLRILEKLRPSIKKEGLRDLPLLWAEEYPGKIDLGFEGRHRMKTLLDLYGDDPVLMNLIKGDRFDMVNSPYYSEPVRQWAGEMNMSPLELMRRRMEFGEKPIEINPLWVGE